MSQDLEKLIKQTKELEQNNDYKQLAEIYRQIATIYHKEKNKEKEQVFLKKSKDAKNIIPVKTPQIKLTNEQELDQIVALPDSNEKLESLESFVKKYPDYSSGYFELAKLEFNLNLFDLSLENTKKIIQILDITDKINLSIAYTNLATILSKDYFKDYELARKYYEKAIEFNPKFEGSYFNYAILLQSEKYKDYELARKYYEKAIELNKYFYDAYNGLGSLYYEKLKEYEKAKYYLEEGLKINASDAYLHSNYAELLANYLHEKEKAKYHFNKAIELKKDGIITNTAREQLKQLAFEGNKPTFINKISINKILHLSDIQIYVDAEELSHLIITGHNGCGKTVLMNRLRDFLQKLIDCEADVAVMHNFEKQIDPDNPELISFKPNATNLYYKYRSGFYVIAHFEARRDFKLSGIQNVENIELPTYFPIIDKDKKTFYSKNNFLKYAVNQYVQAGLASLNNDEKKLNEINRWIENFENIVKTIDSRIEKIVLETKPNYYFSLIPKLPYEKFTFEQLADGFESIFSIAAELILRMQNKSLTTYEVEGLVLLDEPEAHLHLETQKQILPILLKIFPRIQFIVATHSPFILSSLPNAVVFDLEKKIRIEDASAYAYDSIVETYFESDKYSEIVKNKFNKFEELIIRKDLNQLEKSELEKLKYYFENIPSFIAKELIAEYQRLILIYED